MTISFDNVNIVFVAENGSLTKAGTDERKPQGIGEHPGILPKELLKICRKNLKKVVDK
ncbi:hypothetical protein [Mediterraneibacter agrestimuris]|uniref:hypothetical protein n=1 Tax=Mediterraneibacter agrestimuris TaxID=2941333 RepID=UPI00203F2FC6|nr:hypothetical protein [Mediterraneibacter agrestimuris]